MIVAMKNLDHCYSLLQIKASSSQINYLTAFFFSCQKCRFVPNCLVFLISFICYHKNQKIIVQNIAKYAKYSKLLIHESLCMLNKKTKFLTAKVCTFKVDYIRLQQIVDYGFFKVYVYHIPSLLYVRPFQILRTHVMCLQLRESYCH